MFVNPPSLGRPVGFSHGVMAPAGARTLHVAGQTAADAAGTIRHREFVEQFDTALAKVLEVVRAAGGEPAHIVRMTIYVTDINAYRAARPLLGGLWKTRMGAHYPAMAVVGVSGLVDRGATIEIEADAALP